LMRFLALLPVEFDGRVRYARARGVEVSSPPPCYLCSRSISSMLPAQAERRMSVHTSLM